MAGDCGSGVAILSIDDVCRVGAGPAIFSRQIVPEYGERVFISGFSGAGNYSVDDPVDGLGERG